MLELLIKTRTFFILFFFLLVIVLKNLLPLEIQITMLFKMNYLCFCAHQMLVLFNMHKINNIYFKI